MKKTQNIEHVRHLAAAIALLLKRYTQHDQKDKLKCNLFTFESE